MPKLSWLFACCLLLSACGGQPAGTTSGEAGGMQRSANDGDHLVSIDSAEAPVLAPMPAKPVREDPNAPWPDAQLGLGQAFISCATDYTDQDGDGPALPALDRDSVRTALWPCRDTGLLRVRYQGKIDAGFAELAWRLAAVADELDLHRRILDLDSSGGQVEAAIRAGDAIGEANWTIWVREGSICHSACVFVLAAGDNRLIAGKVGIHRMMRISSKATSRAELNRELHEVYGNVKDYLERNGVAVAAADLMMTVPNRSLRLLTPGELKEYGLDGTNAVQDDLLSNHDNPRIVSRFGDDSPQWREKSAMLLATLTLTMKGTPFIYQGDELGLTNRNFTDIDQFNDLWTKNAWKEEVASGRWTPEDFFANQNKISRDHARMPLPWTAEGGFTTGQPWFALNPNHATVNAESGRAIYDHYARLIALRHAKPALVYGDYQDIAPDHPQVFAFKRTLGETVFLIVLNFSSRPAAFDLPDTTPCLGNYVDTSKDLSPWEARIYRTK